MIKNIIIIILILLLIITLYSYYCLAGKMLDYQTNRMEYIVNKEDELNNRETKISEIENCNYKLVDCTKAVSNIIDLTKNIPLVHKYMKKEKNIKEENIKEENIKEENINEENIIEENIKEENNVKNSYEDDIMRFNINVEDDLECEEESDEYNIDDIKRYFSDGVLDENDCDDNIEPYTQNVKLESVNKAVIKADGVIDPGKIEVNTNITTS
tara:strand:- start:6050 stop:6688 length:639 start_codon:yes stop_codon:yes gene_type:complete